MKQSFDTMLLLEYTDILLNNRDNFTPVLFRGNTEYQQKQALKVFKFATYLFAGCENPRGVEQLLTPEFVEKMKLDRVMNYLKFPEELNKTKDFFYVAHMMHPKIVPYDQKSLSLKVYRDILEGRMSKFPKNYMNGADGKKRAEYCFSYMITHFLDFEDTESIYDYFSRLIGTQALKKHKLFLVSSGLFESPVDYLHESLPDGQKNEFLKSFFKYRYICEKFRKNNISLFR